MIIATIKCSVGLNRFGKIKINAFFKSVHSLTSLMDEGKWG